MSVFPLIPALCVVFMTIEDFRQREVSVVCFIALASSIVVASFAEYGIGTILINAASNILLLLYMGAGVMLYLRLRRGRWINPVNSYLGDGDIVYFLILTPFFSIKEFIVFLLISMLTAILWWCVVTVARTQPRTIPLIGISGIVLCLTLVYHALI